MKSCYRNNAETILQNRRGQKGQVAIFIALVFQVLFVFFAMVINVGLLVHQKINLQNSVDLAAYYGAMKQAENLNAIAHINYQIRQAWKLMLFRYQQIGSAGDDVDHPYSYTPKPGSFRSEDDTKEYTRPNAFCMAYDPFNLFPGGQDYCRKVPVTTDDLKVINFPGASTASSALSNLFGGLDRAINAATLTLATKATASCKTISGLNWTALARFIASYKYDIASRKKEIFLIANGMSKDLDDFKDLDGESVKEGIKATLSKNLTPENRATLKPDLEVINSFAKTGCEATGNKDTPPKWLSEVSIYPIFFYLDPDCSVKGIKFHLKIIGDPVRGKPAHPENYEDTISQLLPYIQEPDGMAPEPKLFKSTLGFEKNPWCAGYVGVSAKTQPNIPFSPFGNVTLTAKAYAKPFGGKIGPWYSRSWPSNSPNSDPFAKLIDERVPTRVLPPAIVTPQEAKDPRNIQMNYSRYVGDPVGTRSNLHTGHFGKAIHSMGALQYTWWEQLLSEDPLNPKSNGDVLAWDSKENKAPPMRDLEIAAVAPDHFDLNYYSIEPDFYRNYYSRLMKRKDLGGISIRADLGWRRDDPDEKLKKFSIKDQIEVLKNTAQSPIDATQKLKYYVLNFTHLLNSWQGTDPENYNIDPTRFGKCLTERKNPGSTNPDEDTIGSCAVGGRVGYSVKLVDESYLKGELKAGGDAPPGRLINAP